MNPKFLMLAIVAAIALGLAVWVGSARTPATTTLSDSREVIAGLKASINDVAAIRIIAAESKPVVTLQKSADRWIVVEKDSYPADVGKVREFLLRLADATLLEPKTSVAASYLKLGVEDIALPEADGALVELDGLAKPARVILGHYSGRTGDATFVRLPDQQQSWLAKGNLTVDKAPANWVRRELADIAATRIDQVLLTTGGKTVRAYKDDAAEPNFRIADLPKRRELQSEFVANGLASVMSGLRFDDVLRADAAQPGAAILHSTRYTTFEGLVVDAKAWTFDGKHYAQFEASVDGEKASAYITADQARLRRQYELQKAELAAQAPPATAPSADGAAPAAAPAAEPAMPPALADPVKDMEQRLSDLNAEAQVLAGRFAGWTFVLPAYKFDSMHKTMDELLRPLDGK